MARATQAMLDIGLRDVRNQGVMLHGVNDTAEALLDLRFALLDHARITPYYFYMGDMIRAASTGGCPSPTPKSCSRRSWGTCPGSRPRA